MWGDYTPIFFIHEELSYGTIVTAVAPHKAMINIVGKQYNFSFSVSLL